jgi:hypothetical protein
MALVLSLAVGDVVDIADYSIAVHSVESRKTATLITKDGEKIPVSSKYENRANRLGPTRSVDRQTPREAAFHGTQVSFHFASSWRDDLTRTQFFRAGVAVEPAILQSVKSLGRLDNRGA